MFKGKPGGTGTILIPPYRFPRERLADLVHARPRLTLPADAPPDAALTLEQIEAKIADLTSQAP